MEQTHNSKQMTGRLRCENDSCSDPRTHYCSDCDQVLCVDCSADFRQKCRETTIPDAKKVAYCLETTKSVLSSIMKDSEHSKINSSTNSFDEELKKFTEMLSMINEKFADSIENSNSHEFCSIMKEVVQLQKELTESGLITHSKTQRNVSEVTSISYQRESIGEDLDRLISKGDNETTEHKTENVFEETVFKEDTQNTLEHLYEPMQHAEDSKQVAKKILEKKKYRISDTTWKDIKQRELKILEQEQKIQEAVFSMIYYRHTGKKISDILSFYFQISLKDAKQKSMMRDCVSSRLRMPDLKGIRIDKITDSNADLASFLSNCTPARLRLFVINWSVNNFTAIKSKFYVGAFSSTARRTTKEVYFFCIDFSAKDLQTVIKAAHNTERIVFNMCCIHCSLGLDFGSDLRYNTKLLSFQHCGNMIKGWATDWNVEPLCFSLVVDAIGRSGLRTSLEKLSIYDNHTLSAFKVQEELNSKFMLHISVVEENPEPLTL